jgi:hypothetical protein
MLQRTHPVNKRLYYRAKNLPQLPVAHIPIVFLFDTNVGEDEMRYLEISVTKSSNNLRSDNETPQNENQQQQPPLLSSSSISQERQQLPFIYNVEQAILQFVHPDPGPLRVTVTLFGDQIQGMLIGGWRFFLFRQSLFVALANCFMVFFFFFIPSFF